MKPIEVQRQRTKGWRNPPHTKYVGRGTPYGNPHKVTNKLTAKLAVELYQTHIALILSENPDFLEPLRGWNLSCFCKIGMPCHRQILLELANRPKESK